MAQENPQPAEELGRFDSITDSISYDFSTVTWVLIPLGVGLNAAGAFIANVLRLPLFLDNLGTLLLAIAAGPWAAALTGVAANTVNAILGNPVQLAFIPVPVTMGIAIGYLARRGWFNSPIKVIVPSIVATLITTIVAAPIVIFVFGGATGAGSDLVTSAVLASGQDLVQSVISGQILVNLIDKGVLTFIAYFIVRSTPAQYLPSQGQRIFSDNR